LLVRIQNPALTIRSHANLAPTQLLVKPNVLFVLLGNTALTQTRQWKLFAQLGKFHLAESLHAKIARGITSVEIQRCHHAQYIIIHLMEQANVFLVLTENNAIILNNLNLKPVLLATISVPWIGSVSPARTAISALCRQRTLPVARNTHTRATWLSRTVSLAQMDTIATTRPSIASPYHLGSREIALGAPVP